MRPELDSVVAEAGFTHGDIMESFGYAAAMMHMNSIQQRNFRGHERRRLLNDLKKRKIEEGTPDYKSAVERFDKLFGRAQADLARGRLELRTKMEELGLDPKVPENEIRARSALYQERIEAYYGKLKKLDKLRKKRIGERPPGRTKKDRARIHKEMLAKEKADPELVKRRAEIEREMAYFLREGIETYSGSSTLDIVVVQMQIAKLKMGPALLDQNFTLAGSLSGLKKEHIDFMVRDQCLMMVEHVNGYFYGHELPYNSGKALAKYAQRALLAMKIKGDLNIKALVDASDMSDPALRLHRMCERLMEQKPNPTGFNDVLSSFTPEGNPDAGLVELINVIEKVVPGMEYQSDRDNFEHLPKLKTMSADANPFEVRRFFQYHRFIRLRENREVEEKVLKHGGAEVLEQYCKSRMTEVHTALQEIEERYARYMEMGSTYAPKDWPEVLRLERSIHGLKLVSRNVPGQPQPEWGKIVTGPMQKMERRLQELKQTRRTDLGPFSSPYYTRLWLQMNHLKLLITYYEEQLKKAAELKVKEAKLTALNLSGVWTFKNGDQKGRAKIEHNGRDIKIWLTSDILTAKAPHFIVEGTYRRGHILGYWTELHSPPLKFNARNLAPAKNWKNRGLFVGDVSIDRSFIKLTNASTELPRNDETGLRWAGMLLNPAGDDVSAPTNLEIFNVTQRSLPQKKPGEDSPSSPRRKMGSVYIKQYGPDGGHASTRFALYTPATYGTSKPDLVANGTTFSPKEVLPGTYELVVQLGSKLVRKNLSVRADEVTTYSLPALGQLKLKLIDHTGKEFYDPNFLLRVARNNKPIGWASDTPLKVGAATYQITIHRGGGPVGRGSSYTREVTVAEGQETLVTLRFGAFRFDLTDVDGKPSKGARVEIEYVSEDGSTGGTFSEMSSADIPLIPGKYRYKAWLQQGGSQSGEVQVLPAELEKQSSGLGMLSLLANGRPIRNSDKHSIMLTPLNPPGDFIVVHNLKRPQLFPGTYRAQLLDPEGKSSEKLEFTVESGKAANLDFKMK
ncbi:MAG: OmpH family outer membrane protein, partial [Verrucomicrobiota bacterium]